MTDSKYLLDTYAWIEYIKGTKKGEKVRKILTKKVLVSDATFAEIYSWAIRANKNPGIAIALIRSKSHVVEVNTNIWTEGAAAKEKIRINRPNFGLIDGLLLAIQHRTGATIVTGDPHFKGMKNVILL